MNIGNSDGIHITEFEDFTEIIRKRQFVIYNVNEKMFEVSITATNPIIKIDPVNATISSNKKIEVTVELNGKLQKSECIVVEYRSTNTQNRKLFVIKKDSVPWNLVSLTPLLLGLTIADILINTSNSLSLEITPWIFFILGLVVMSIQISLWPISLKT